MRKNKNGFTLVELLLVIAILAIVIAITIPMVAEITDNSKKKAFYLYALNLVSKAQEKYVSTYSNLDEFKYDDWVSAQCVTYNIKNDLAIKNTGNYEGWVQITRIEPDQSTIHEKLVNIPLSITVNETENQQLYENTGRYKDGILYPKYCVSDDGSTCTPDRSINVQEYQYNLNVTKTLKEGQKLCVNYQKAVNGKLTNTDTVCKGYSDSDAQILPADYKYQVVLTFKDNSYAISNINMEGMKEKDFANKLDEEMQNRSTKSVVEKLQIVEPLCPGVTRDPEILGTGEYIEQSTVSTTTEKVKEEILLKTLRIKGYDIGFNSGQLSYSLEVPNYVNSVEVYAEPMVDTTKVTYSSSTNLSIGRNLISVTLEDGEGNSNRYIVYINRLNTNTTRTTISTTTTTRSTRSRGVVIYTTREITTVEGAPDPALPESNAQLEFLTISKHEDFNFDPDTYYYDLKINDDEDMLYLNYRAKNPNAVVIVTGNSKLKNGSQVEILVRSENEYYTKSYVINIYREGSTISYKLLFRVLAIILGVLLLVIMIWLTITRRSMRLKRGKQVQVITKQSNNNGTSSSVFDSAPKKVVINTNKNDNNGNNTN